MIAMIGPRCLIGVGDIRDSFQARFARGENGFVGTNRVKAALGKQRWQALRWPGSTGT
jgi:hypothetical protein